MGNAINYTNGCGCCCKNMKIPYYEHNNIHNIKEEKNLIIINRNNTYNKDTCNKINASEKEIDIRPNIKFIKETNDYLYILSYVNSIIKIQNAYRKYRMNKRLGRKLKQNEHDKIKQSIEINKNKGTNINNNIYSSNNYYKNKTLTDELRNSKGIMEDEDFLSSLGDISEENEKNNIINIKDIIYNNSEGEKRKYDEMNNSMGMGRCDSSVFSNKNDGNKSDLTIHSLPFTNYPLSPCRRTNSITQNDDEIKGLFLKKPNKNLRFFGSVNKKNGKKSGFGIVKWDDGSELRGIFKDSMLNGIARFYNSSNKSEFIGEYINNCPRGYGLYKSENITIEGYWERNVLVGICEQFWKDGSYYQGNYDNNRKQGLGLYKWPDGTIYKGMFTNDYMNGYGIIHYNEESTYYGEINNGYMEGFGVFKFPSGSIYIGYYLQDMKHGFGVFSWPKSSKIFAGFWEMGRQQGPGAVAKINGIEYYLFRRGKIEKNLMSFYDLDKYLTKYQKKYVSLLTQESFEKLKEILSNV